MAVQEEEFAQDADGSATMRVGELELRHRIGWLVELQLPLSSSCVEQTVRLVNRTAGADCFLADTVPFPFGRGLA